MISIFSKGVKFFMFDDEELLKGVSCTLRYLKNRGCHIDLFNKNFEQPKKKSLIIDHVNDNGESLSSKNAYKELSRKFHGKYPKTTQHSFSIRKKQTETFGKNITKKQPNIKVFGFK